MRTKLDLHGVRHAEVDRMVENFILLNQKNFPLEIICGNSNKMISIVTTVARRLNCEIGSRNYGSIVIRGWR
jgi:hypothetical protein